MDNISDKQFVRKASARISAIAFLESYEAHIRTNYPDAVVALDMYREGKLLPTPALEFVKQVAAKHILQGMINKAGESIKKHTSASARKSKSGSTRTSSIGQGKYYCQIFVKMVNERTRETSIEVFVDHNGHDTFRADTYSAAERIVDRKQTDVIHAQYATVSQELPSGKVLTTNISRDDSIARFLKAPRGPVCKVKPQSAPLKQTMSVHNYVATFSRG